MAHKRHLLATLFTCLTLLSLSVAGGTFVTLNDSYPDRKIILKNSTGLCNELLAKSRFTSNEISQLVQKYLSKTAHSITINYDTTGWTMDLFLQGFPSSFLRMYRNNANFTFDYRQSKLTIEAIANISLSHDCQQISEARFTYYNSALRPVQRVKIDSSFQQIQSVIMEEPIKEVSETISTAKNLVRIGIIDSGIDYNHPVLIGKSRPMLGIDLTNQNRPPYDYTNTIQNELMGKHFSHGTAVADIASRNVEALIVPVRTENQSILGGAAIEYLAKNDVRIVNISQGTSRMSEWLPLKAAIQNHPEMLFIVAAGNESRNIDQESVYPSSFELHNMLVVASINNHRQLSPFSNYGFKHVHFAALGENISAALAGGGQWTVNGTSFAAPLVANIAAKLLSKNPSLTTQDLRKLLMQRAKPVAELKDKIQFGVLVDE